MKLAQVVAVLVSIAGCATEPAEPVRPTLRLAGTYMIDALARAYTKALPTVTVTSHSMSPASAVDAVARGAVDLAVGAADSVYATYVEQRSTADGRALGHRVRAISVIGIAPLILLARPATGIKTVSDLRGHLMRNAEPTQVDLRFGTGWIIPPGLSTVPDAASTRVTSISQLVLLAFGVSPQSIRSRSISSQVKALAELEAGRLDAMYLFDWGGVFNATRAGMLLVPIEGPAVDRLRSEYAFLRPLSIPAGTYFGQSGPLHTVGVDLVLICRADLDEQLVYDVTKAHLNALPRVWADASLIGLPHEIGKSFATPIPLHSGAARYYREWELFR